MALTGCRRNHPERLKRNQNPSCFSLEGFRKPWVQSKRVGGGASEQPCWFQEVGRWRRWGRAVGLEVQVYLLPPAGRSQDKGHSRGREKRNEADLWGPADKLLPPQPGHHEQQPLQSLIDWPRPSVSVTRGERSAFAPSINTWSAHWSPPDLTNMFTLTGCRRAANKNAPHFASSQASANRVTSWKSQEVKVLHSGLDVWSLHLLPEEARRRPRAAAAPVSGPPQVQKD